MVTEINIWIIIGSVIGAILLLIIVVVVLWKVSYYFGSLLNPTPKNIMSSYILHVYGIRIVSLHKRYIHVKNNSVYRLL